MGQWSQLAGRSFLDWLAPAPGRKWLDVGCGNGAFTELILQRCAPESVIGIDPSEGQLAFARSRFDDRRVEFQQGNAMSLSFGNDAFDVAVMPLVIFFVPQPAEGVAEMVRVVTSGGAIAAYAWDMAGGGFPYELLTTEMKRLGMPVPEPPSADASRPEVLRELWTAAGCEAIETRVITVERTFKDFEDYWATVLAAPSVGATLRGLSASAAEPLRAAVRPCLPTAADGSIVCKGWANAVQGRVRK